MGIRSFFRNIKVKFFAQRRIERSGMFDALWYVKQYPEVAQMNVAPIKHFLTIGYRTGCDPSPCFSLQRYDTAYPQAKNKYRNLLVHYLFYGEKHKYKKYGIANTDEEVRQCQNPLVSVIVTSYNYEKYIAETLDSLCAQTYRNFEVIVVDDGSKDTSMEIVEKYTRKYSNIKSYTHDHNANKGIIASMKLGIQKAKGEYIAFCESDDYWAPNYLDEKISLIQRHQDSAILSNDIQLVGDPDCISVRQGYIDHINKFLRLGRNDIDIYHNQNMNFIPTLSSVMIKREVLSKLDYSSPVPAWIDFWLYRQILKEHPLLYVDKKLTYWRQHISYNGNQVAEEYDNKIAEFLPQSNALLGITEIDKN